MKFSQLPDNALFRIGTKIAGVQESPHVYRKIPVLHGTAMHNGVVRIFTFVNTVRLGDGQVSGCGPDVEVRRVHRVEHHRKAA